MTCAMHHDLHYEGVSSNFNEFDNSKKHIMSFGTTLFMIDLMPYKFILYLVSPEIKLKNMNFFLVRKP